MAVVLSVGSVFTFTFRSGLGLVATFRSASLLLFELAALALTLMSAYEGFSARCRIVWSHRAEGPPPFDPASAPFVSIHIPTYSEPRDLVIETLDALARLDYPRLEVVVVDNNTTDPTLWGVARIVDGCTDSLESPKPKWHPRKAAYLARPPSKPRSVLRVSVADKLHNVRAVLRDQRRYAPLDRVDHGRPGRAAGDDSARHAAREVSLTIDRDVTVYRDDVRDAVQRNDRRAAAR